VLAHIVPIINQFTRNSYIKATAMPSSACPIDVQQVKRQLREINDKLALPWIPWYTQTGAEAEDPSSLSALEFWAVAATISFTIIVFCLEGNLDARQQDAYRQTEFPAQLETTVSAIDDERKRKAKDESNEDEFQPLLPQLQAKFRSAQTYGLDKIQFGMISSAYDTAESVAFILLGFLPFVWDKSVQLGNRWFQWTEAENEIKITLIFLGIVTLIGTVTSLPFELVSGGSGDINLGLNLR
jgi:hypothetical protein